MPEPVYAHHRMQALDRLAARQLGLITSEQLGAIGFGRPARDGALSAGKLRPVRKGVYRLPGVALTWESAVLAAVLAAGPGAVASHLSAAELWELFDGWVPAGRRDVIHLVGPRQRHLSGVQLHRLRVDGRDRTRRGLVPVTSPARTIFDLASVFDAEALGRCTDEALRRRLLTLTELRRLFDRHAGAGRRRLGPLRVVLGDRVPGFDPGANSWEQQMDRQWEQLGLPAAVRQHTIRVGGRRYRVDRAIPELKLAVEWVGTEFHSLNGRFVRDRMRISDLVQSGWDVVEVTPHWTPKRLRATVLAKVAERRLVAGWGAGQPRAAR